MVKTKRAVLKNEYTEFFGEAWIVNEDTKRGIIHFKRVEPRKSKGGLNQ